MGSKNTVARHELAVSMHGILLSIIVPLLHKEWRITIDLHCPIEHSRGQSLEKVLFPSLDLLCGTVYRLNFGSSIVIVHFTDK